MTDTIADLELSIGYKFSEPALLTKALTHSSTGMNDNYQRLEFLGDRVLGLIMARILFDTFPDEDEGGLAKRHSALVQGRTLSEIAIEFSLGHFIIMSDSERDAGGEENENILADVMEAVLAAIYMDGGLEPVEALIRRWWGNRIHTMERAPQDPKTALQEWVQAKGLPLPSYEICGRDGPDHAPRFCVQVKVQGKPSVEAEGMSRRQAEKLAAEKMLKILIKGKA